MTHDLPDTLQGRFDELLARLDRCAAAAGRRRPRRGHGDSYMACCPAHDDSDPSLALRLEGDKILAHCFGTCETEDVVAAVGMPMEALFADYRGERSTDPKLHWNGSSKVAEDAIEAGATSQLDTEWLAMPPPLSEFLALDFPPSRPILGPIETQQIVMLYAPTGVGKSMFALSLAHAMTRQKDFIGWKSYRGVNVLFVDGEMTGVMLQKRLSHTKNNSDSVPRGDEKMGHRGTLSKESGELYVANVTNWGISEGYDPVNLAEKAGQDIVNVWAETRGAEVIVLDNLMSLAWQDGVSMSSDEFWQPLRRFAQAQRARGRTVVIVDHSNAAGDIFGTKTKTWHSDLAMKLARIDTNEDDGEADDPFHFAAKKARFQLSFSKVRGTPDSSDQSVEDKVITIGEVSHDWDWESGRSAQRSAARDMKGNGLSIRDIATELGVSSSTVGRWVKGV